MAVVGIGAALLFSLQVPAGLSDGESCRTDPKVEAAAVETEISQRAWNGFAAVAALRQREGLEVLPGQIGCPTIGDAAVELLRHGPTKALLARYGLAVEAYVGVGWALIVADDPEFFGVEPTAAVAANGAFIRSHQQQVRRLLDAD